MNSPDRDKFDSNEQLRQAQEISVLEAVFNAPTYSHPDHEMSSDGSPARGILLCLGGVIIGWAGIVGVGVAAYENGPKGMLLTGTVAVGGLALALNRIKQINQTH